MANDAREVFLEVMEAALDAQLRAVRKLRRSGAAKAGEKPRQRGRSHMSIVEDILQEASSPLHVSVIIERAKARFAQELDRESLVSALTKRVTRKDRFVRTAPNTFALLASKPVKGGRPAS
jgi:hypothetical protein